MRAPDAGLLTHYGLQRTTIATAMRIDREDGLTIGFTTADISETFDGVVYQHDPGLLVSNIVSTAGFAVGNLEIKTANDGTIFTKIDLFNGAWRNAAFSIFRYNFESPADGVDPLLDGTFGEFEIQGEIIKFELRDLRQYLQQSVGAVSSKTCRARLGDARCTKDLTSFTYNGTLTSVTSNQVFKDSARTEGENWFADGQMKFTSGPNSGRWVKVKTNTADGTITLDRQLFGTVAVGQTYTIIAGCLKRREEDCDGKFDNVLNFDGEPDRQGIDSLTAAPDVQA